MARANPQAHTPHDDQPDSGEWGELRSELVALLDQVESQTAKAGGTGPVYDALAERVRDLRHQVAESAPEARHREALRSVQRAVDRFNEREEPQRNPRDTLEAAIRQIRARHAPSGAQATAAAAAAPRIDGWAQAAEGISTRLERLEGELRVHSRGQNANIKEITEQIAQLSHVMELLAGAVGEVGQVKRLESQIASLANILAEEEQPDLAALNARLDEVSASVVKLSELAGLGDRLDDVSANVARLADLQAEFAARPQSAATLDTSGLEDGIRKLYDRIDAIEDRLALPPAELEALSGQLSQIAAAMVAPAQPQGLLELIDALNTRVAEIETRSEEVGALRDDLQSLRESVISALEPRFAALETGIDAKLAAFGAEMRDSMPKLNTAPLEAQVRQLVARMDQTGEQLSGLAKLYTGAPAAPPDISELADLVAEKTSAAVTAATTKAVSSLAADPKPGRLDAADLDEIERRVAQAMEAKSGEEPSPELLAVETTIRAVNERLGRLEAMLTAKPEADTAALPEPLLSPTAETKPAEPTQSVTEPSAAPAPSKPAASAAAVVIEKRNPRAAGIPPMAEPGKPSTEAFVAALLANEPDSVTEPVAPAKPTARDPDLDEAMRQVASPEAIDASLATDDLLELADSDYAKPSAKKPGVEDAMPASPAADAPLIDKPFPEPTPGLSSPEAAVARRMHPGLDQTPEIPPRPVSDFDDSSPAKSATDTPVDEESLEPALGEFPPPPSRNNFIEAHRRAARVAAARQTTPTDDSLIGKAFARFQAQRDAALAKSSEPVAPPPEANAAPPKRGSWLKKRDKSAAAELASPAGETGAAAPADSTSAAVTPEPPAVTDDKPKARSLFSFARSGAKSEAKAKDTDAETKPVKPEKAKRESSKSKAEPKTERRLAGDKISPTTWSPADIRAAVAGNAPPQVSLGAEATSPSGPVMQKESFLLRHRRPILLGASLIAIACLAVNLINQRLAEQEAAVASSAVDVGDAALSPVPVADQDVDAIGGPVAPPVIDAMTTASVSTAPAQAFSRSVEPMPDTAAFAAAQVADLGDKVTLPELASPVKVDLPPSGIGPDSLRTAAANGDARAQFEVAAIYTEGRAVPEDMKQAAVWYERAASQGFAPAQYRLGTLYEHGNGLEKDLTQARLWYQRAAEAGNRLAMHNLAALYAGGNLGTQQFDAAAKWFEEAANRGIKDSQFNLGMLYARGLGVQQDLEQSYKWFGIAASRGDADAAKARDDMAASLDAATVKRLNEEIAAWTPAKIDLVANFAPIGTWQTNFDPGRTIDTPEVVRGVQMALNMLGYDVGTPDGLAGPKTTEAIRAFETATGMSESGEINPRLLAVLGSQPV